MGSPQKLLTFFSQEVLILTIVIKTCFTAQAARYINTFIWLLSCISLYIETKWTLKKANHLIPHISLAEGSIQATQEQWLWITALSTTCLKEVTQKGFNQICRDMIFF